MTTQQRYPTSDEATTGTWATAPFWSAVDDASDTDFITCTGLTSGRGRQTFGFSVFTVPAGATGISVAVNFRGKKAASQAANVGAALKVGGTYYNAAGRNPATSFTAYTDTWATNPKTAAAWTVDDVNGVGANALQAFGGTTSDTTPNVSVSSCEIVVTYTPALVTLTGTAAGVATTTGASRVARALVGTTTGVAATSGAARVARALAGTAQGLAATTASLTVVGIKLLAGVAAGVATTTGAIQVLRALAGTVTGVATTQAVLGIRRGLVGTTQGLASTTGTVQMTRGLSSLAAASATTAGSLTIARAPAESTRQPAAALLLGFGGGA